VGAVRLLLGDGPLLIELDLTGKRKRDQLVVEVPRGLRLGWSAQAADGAAILPYRASQSGGPPHPSAMCSRTDSPRSGREPGDPEQGRSLPLRRSPVLAGPA
jgi:hypothetical protein